MFVRALLLCCFLLSSIFNVYGAECTDVFPSGWRELPPANEQLVNFPANNSAATLSDGTTLPRGNNLYLNSNLANRDEIFVGPVTNSETTARLFLRTSVSWQNVKINENGNPEDLIIVIDGSLQITGGSTVINAIIYVKGAMTINGNGTINGAVTVVGSADNFTVNYTENYITDADFNGMCDNSSGAIEPIASYRFDETEYAEATNEIVDSIGGFHGLAKDSQPVEGKVCNAIDLSATGTSNYAILNKDILTGKTDFSISLWAKTSKTSNQSILSGAGASSSNELIMWFTSHTQFRPYLRGGQNGAITTDSIADDSWHHIVWTREGSQSCLFVDKVLQGCVTQTTLPLSIQSLILGQEQDSIGGRFSSSQVFDGLIDEFLIFDQAISVADITSIYDNQDAGLGYDGSARDCPVAVFPSPVVDIHFDELDWTDANSVLDSSGNDYHANAVNVTPTDGFICNAADLSASGVDDYITLDSDALNNRSNFSISLWYKTPKTGAQSLISGAKSSQFNELIFWFTSSTRFSLWIKGGTRTIVTNTVAGDVWHHLVWTRSGSKNLLYRDGVLQTGSASLTSGSLDITSLILGQEQGSLGGRFDSSQAVEGLIDELLIFDEELSSTEVSEVYTNQSSGLHYDGTAVNCPEPKVAILNMRFDEGSWTGAAGEVIDETGNFNSQSKNGADTSSLTPAHVGNPGTCGYGIFDGVNDYVALPNSFDNQQGSFTITAWINPSNLDRGSRIFADDESNSQGYAFSLGDPGSGKLRFYSRGVTPISVDTLASVIPTNTWTFVAAVHDVNAKTREIYVNGVAQIVTGNELSNTYSGSWGVDNGIASIGGETDLGEIANRFTGAIDEVRVYQGALTSTEIVTIQNETHPCTSYIDHFEINHDGQGLTCEAESITIKACADASCSTLNNDTTDVQLSINGTLDKTVTVAGGSVNTNFSYTNAGTATLSLDQTFACKNGPSTSCDVVFADTGFRFFSNVEGTSIPTQLSGKPSNTGFEASSLKVQAIEKNPETGACQAAFINTTAIEMAATCVDPTACAGSQVAINNFNTTTNIDTLDNGALLTYDAVGLNFGDATVNSAEFVFTYPDAGKVQLHARYNIPDTNGDPSGNYMLGSSNAFVVRPFGFYVDVTGNPKAQTAAGDKFIAAGENFSTSLTAVLWQAADDSIDNNGTPDNGANLSDNTATLNFGNEISPETALIEQAFFLPNPSVLGNLANSNFSGFVDGKATVADMTYDEVGIISFSASLPDNSYLGTGDIIGSEPYVGRFIPDHFELVSSNGDLAAYCDNEAVPEAMDFAYSGQMSTATPSRGGVIRYSLNPSFTITAKSKGGANTTKNYTGDFMQLEASGITRLTPNLDYTTAGTLGNKMALTADLNAITTSDLQNNESEGVITYTYHDDDNFVYVRNPNAESNKFTSDINLQIESVIDKDLVNAKDADDDFDGGDPANALDSVLTLEPTGIEIRFGRAYLANSFGPETSTLPQELAVQYFEDEKYIPTEDDICSLYNSSNISFGATNEVGLNVVNIQSVNGQFDELLDEPDGITRAIVLPAAGVGNRGKVDIIYGTYDWLKYDWNWSGVEIKSFDEDPDAVATFGLFRGNDRIIYQREVSN